MLTGKGTDSLLPALSCLASGCWSTLPIHSFSHSYSNKQRNKSVPPALLKMFQFLQIVSHFAFEPYCKYGYNQPAVVSIHPQCSMMIKYSAKIIRFFLQLDLHKILGHGESIPDF